MLLSKHYLRIILLYTALYQILSRYTEDKKQASKTQTYIQTEAQKKKTQPQNTPSIMAVWKDHILTEIAPGLNSM